MASRDSITPLHCTRRLLGHGMAEPIFAAIANCEAPRDLVPFITNGGCRAAVIFTLLLLSALHAHHPRHLTNLHTETG